MVDTQGREHRNHEAEPRPDCGLRPMRGNPAHELFVPASLGLPLILGALTLPVPPPPTRGKTTAQTAPREPAVQIGSQTTTQAMMMPCEAYGKTPLALASLR